MQTKDITYCPLCKNKKSKFVCEIEGYEFRKCFICGLVFLKNVPTREFFKKFYSYSDTKGFNKQIKRINPLLSIFLNNQLLLKLVKYWGELVNRNWESSVLSLKESGRILDVGCGPAVLLGRLKKRGWDVYGLEVGDKLVAEASQKIGRERVINGELPKVHKKLRGKFDVVSFWHVLEHIDNFQENLMAAKKILKRGGYLIIEVPHSDSLNFKLFGNSWTFLMPPQHLHFWNRNALKRLLERNIFTINKIVYPNYFAFVLSSSLVKKYKTLIIITPLLMLFSILASLIFSYIKKGDVIRVYAKIKK